MNSPASDSRLTARRRYPTSYYRVSPGSFGRVALSRRAQNFPGRFQALFTGVPPLLFSFPSRYSFAIGLGTYLALGADNPQLPERIPTPGTRGTGDSPPRLRLRGCHPLRPRTSTGVRLPVVGSAPGPAHTTSPAGYPYGVRFGLCRFRSPLLTASRLLSFPAGTKMFQFPAFPVLLGPIRRSPVLRLHAPRRGVSPLATAFFGARAEPSTGRVGPHLRSVWSPMRGLIRSSALPPRPFDREVHARRRG